jgi:hypothetical protein
MTPVQLTRNLTAIFRTQTAGPSPELERAIGLEIAADAIRGEQSASLA